MKRVKAILVMGLLTVSGLPSFSYAEDNCPETAVANLYIIKTRILQGQEKDINKVVGYAQEGLIRCPDSFAAQALVAELYTMVGESLPLDSYDDKFTTYSKAYEAFLNHDRTFDNDAASTKIDFSDGQTRTYYSFNSASGAMQTSLARLAALKIHKKEHEVFDPASYENATCPYKWVGRIEAETKGYNQWIKLKGKDLLPQDTFFIYRRYAANRLEGIWKVCPDFRSEHSLTYNLADYFEYMARFLEEKNPPLALDYAKKAKFYGETHAAYQATSMKYKAWTTTRKYSDLLGFIRRLEEESAK